MKTWLVLDCNYLCHRAMHSTGNLSYMGNPTGVVFGFLSSLRRLRGRFATNLFVFCFDEGRGLREREFPFYKRTRHKKELTKEQLKTFQALKNQVHGLKYDWLSAAGFPNVFYQDGYEADDVIASVVHNLDEDEQAIVVSGDHDMYQLISSRVSVFHPREDKFVTDRRFGREYGIHPPEWVTVKALAGCHSDGVPGMRGVGEKTALKFLTRPAELHPAVRTGIARFLQSSEFTENLRLVRLPFPGLKKYVPVEFNVAEPEIKKLIDKFGIKSLEFRN